MIDFDATLITAHSDKERRGRALQGRLRVSPAAGYADGAARCWPAILRPGNAGANNAADHIAVFEPRSRSSRRRRSTRPILVARRLGRRQPRAGRRCREGGCASRSATTIDRAGPRRRSSRCPRTAWRAGAQPRTASRATTALGRRAHRRTSTSTRWPAGSRVIVRRERPHPGAQLSLHRPRRAPLPGDHHRPARPRPRRPRGAPPRPRARRGPHPRRQETPAWPTCRSRDFALNEAWLELALVAHDLIVWTQRCCSTASSPAASPSACATGCCTSPAASPSTPAEADAAPRPRLALGRRARRRVQAPRRAAAPDALNRAPGARPTSTPKAGGRRRRSGCPHVASDGSPPRSATAEISPTSCHAATRDPVHGSTNHAPQIDHDRATRCKIRASRPLLSTTSPFRLTGASAPTGGSP